MDLDRYLRTLRRGWRTLLLLALLGAGAGVGITLATTPVYRADVQLFVATAGADASKDSRFAQDRVQSYASIADGPAVTRSVIARLGLRLSVGQLGDRISADAPPGTVLVNLHVTDTVPATARRLADAVADRFITVVQQTERTGDDGASAVKLTVIHPATEPQAPISPDRVRNIVLALLGGLLLGVGVVLVRDALDTTVRTPDDLREFGVPVFGVVPFDKRVAAQAIAFRDDLHSRRSEAYRQLRTNLQFVDVDDAPRVIAVTGAVPGEGKTTTAINLAAALAEGGFSVCLVEADLRRPRIADLLGVSPDIGFTTALLGRSAVAEAVQDVGRNLRVLTCGPVPPNPSELLITDRARSILDEIAASVDYTIVDTAPLLPVADGAEAAALADATLLVHHAGHSTRDHVRRSIEALAKVGERPVGVVLNMMPGRGGVDEYVYTYSDPDWTTRLLQDPTPDRPASTRTTVG